MSQTILMVVAAAGLNFASATPNDAQKLRGYSTIYYDPTSNAVPRVWWQLSADKTRFEQFPGMNAPVIGSVSWSNILGDPYDNDVLTDALNAKVDGGVFTAAMELKYTFPVGGIPRSDMDDTVNTLLDKVVALPAEPVISINGDLPDVAGNVLVTTTDLGLGRVENYSSADLAALPQTLQNKVTVEPKVLATNGAYLGRVRDGFNSGLAITVFKMVYIDFAGVLRIADNSSATPAARGMAVIGAAAPGQPMRFLHDGPVRNDAWNWTPGGDVFLAAAGGLTQTVPSGAGIKAQIIGYALSPTLLYVCMGQCLTVAG